MKVHIKWEYNLKGHFLAYGKVKFKALQISEYCNNFIAWPMPRTSRSRFALNFVLVNNHLNMCILFEETILFSWSYYLVLDSKKNNQSFDQAGCAFLNKEDTGNHTSILYFIVYLMESVIILSKGRLPIVWAKHIK